MRSFLFIAVALASAADESERTNPIRRVVTLLQNMQKKVQEEGETEKSLYDKFQCFCSGNTKNLSTEVQTAKEKINTLTAKIQELIPSKSGLDQEIVEHKQDRVDAMATIDKATSIRKKENDAYMKEAGDSQANIDALSRAVQVLGKGMGVAAFAQTDSADLARLRKMALLGSDLSGSEKETLSSFLSVGASPYGEYQASSGEIVGILKQMKDQINKDLGGIVEVEESAVKAFEQTIKAKKAEIAATSKAIEKKQVRSGEMAVAIVESKNDKKDTENGLSDNQRFLANLSIQCDNKATEWETRQKTRADELVAISEVIQMLNNDDSLDMFKKTLPTPGKPKGFALLQGDFPRNRALALIKSVDHKNTNLNLLSFMLSSKAVNFAKVIKMIEDMVAHLGNEQKDDDHHLSWCHKELEDSDDKKVDLKGKIDDSTTEIAEFTDSIKVLAQEIATLKEGITELDRQVADATEQRKKENTEFIQESSDLSVAQQILGKAKNRLNKFYNPAMYKPLPKREMTEEERIESNMNQSLSFLQKRQPEAPETFEGQYKKKGQQTTGVIALVDRLVKDMETQLIEGKKDEERAQGEYETLMKDASEKRAGDSKAITDKSGAKAGLEVRLQDSKGIRKQEVQDMMDTQKYISNVHGSCDFLLENAEFRKQARASERDALLNAKAVLHGAKSFLQVSQEPKAEDPAKESAKDLEINYAKIAPFGREDTAHELQNHAASTQDTLVDAVENAEVSEIKRSVFRSLTRLRAATIKEFDTIARLETQAIDAYNDAHHYRAENPLAHLHDDEAAVPTDKLKSFH